jgi:hypothetical protein
MPKKFFIFLIIFLLVFGFLIFNPRKIEIIEAQGPIAAMKTKVDGYFYVPILNPQSLKVDRLFDNPDLEGDQGGSSGEYSIVPDGKVDTIGDLRLVSKHFGENEGDPNWEYMADVVPDRKVDMIGDERLVSKNFGKSGTYIFDLAGVTVEFDTGNICNLNGNNTCNIPSGAKEFWVKKNGAPIGAYILFYAGPAPFCNDTDGGENKLVKGTCTDATGSYTDACIDATHIEEYTCNPAGNACVGVVDTGCPADHPNCVDGVCVLVAAKTCAQLGGTCCPSGQTCIAGKISGASDCSECCSDVANCQSGGEGGESGGSSFFNIINPLACNTIPECIEKIISFILWIGTAIFPIIIIIAGFLFLTSGGDPEKVRTAKRTIFWAVIGLVIVLLARGIISVIKSVIAK